MSQIRYTEAEMKYTGTLLQKLSYGTVCPSDIFKIQKIWVFLGGNGLSSCFTLNMHEIMYNFFFLNTSKVLSTAHKVDGSVW